MSLEGPVIYALKSEIREHLVGGRVVRVGQLGKMEIGLEISHRGRSYILRLSAHPAFSHICFFPREGGRVRPGAGFAPVLGGGIGGSTLSDVTQPDFDRILRFGFRKKAKLTPFVEYVLVAELLGRYSNLILLDHGGKILASLRSSTKGRRRIIPGITYQPPPSLRGLNPLQAPLAEIRAELEKDRGLPIGLALQQGIRGFSAGLVGEILEGIGIDPSDQSLNEERMGDLLGEVGRVLDDWRSGRFHPQVCLDQEGRPRVVSITEVGRTPGGRRKKFGSVNEAIRYLFDERKEWEEFSRRRMDLLRALERKERDLGALLQKLEGDYRSSRNAEDYKAKGDLVISWLKGLRKGMERVELPDPYDPQGKPIEVKLDPKRTPQENAQLYYKLYGKAKRAQVHLRGRLVDLKGKLRVIEALRDKLREATDLSRVEEIEGRLWEVGLKPAPVRRRYGGEPQSKFRRFYTSDGWEVVLGRGGNQNDELTHKMAKPNDIWLHAQGVPGSHVIIRRGGRKDSPSQKALSEAASAAAFFSRARTSKVAPVLYTLRKWVRRPKGAKPGVVLLQREKTIFVEPRKPPFPEEG